MIQEAGKQVNYFEDFHHSQKREASSLGELCLSMEESGEYEMYLDNEPFYAVTIKQNASIDIRIVVMDKDTMEILDNAGFSVEYCAGVKENNG